MAFTPSNIITRARRLYNVNTTQYSDADALADLNELKNNFLSALINAVEEDWNWDKWTADTVALQGEYTLPLMGASTAGAKQIKQVSISYDWLTYENIGTKIYYPATLKNPNTLENHWSWYEENQSKNFPIYYIADDSLFIAPIPLSGEAGADYLELRGIKSIPDYTTNTTEAEMVFPLDVQQLFVQGMEPYAMRTKWMDRNEVNAAIAEYERLQTKKIKEMTTRYETAMYMEYPEETSSDLTF